MANFIHSLRGTGGLPFVSRMEAMTNGLFSASGTYADLKRHTFDTTPAGFATIADFNTAQAYRNWGIASGLPVDNFEVLLRCTIIDYGNSNLVGTGICALLSGSKSTTSVNDCYQVGLGSGSSWNTSAIIYRNASGTATIINSAPSSLRLSYESFLRVRRSGSNIYVKAWDSNVAEPSAWTLSTSHSSVACTCLYLQTYTASYRVICHELAIATNGDTATLTAPSLQEISGSIGADSATRLVSIIDAQTGFTCEAVLTDAATGNWTAKLYHSRPVYAQISALAGTVTDIPLAKGAGYLSSSFPDSITSVEGVPVSAEVRVLLRYPTLPRLDGRLIASTTSAADGTWRINGLNPAQRYDVVARLAGQNDVIMAGITPAV